MNVGVSSVVIVSPSLRDDVIDDSAVRLVVLVGVRALLLVMVDLVQIVPVSCVELVLGRVC